jgi:hypothetical protein
MNLALFLFLRCAILAMLGFVFCDASSVSLPGEDSPRLVNYSMEFVEVINENNKMNVKFENSPGDGSLEGRFEIFVPDQSQSTRTISDINKSCYSDGGKLYIGPGISIFESSIGESQSTFSFAFDKNVNEKLPFYYRVSSDKAKFQVCVKFTVSKIVNDRRTDIMFREVAISVDVHLDGLIVSSQPRGESSGQATEQMTQSKIVSVEPIPIQASVCDGYNDVTIAGDAVQLCLYSTNPDTRILSVLDVEIFNDNQTQIFAQDGSISARREAQNSSLAITTSKVHSKSHALCPEGPCVHLDFDVLRFFPSPYGSTYLLKGIVIFSVEEGSRSAGALVPQESHSNLLRHGAAREDKSDLLNRKVYQFFETSFDLPSLAVLGARNSKTSASFTSDTSAAVRVGATLLSFVLTVVAGLAIFMV